MIETLHNARGLDRTRVKRAFGNVVTFRDFPAGAVQFVGGASMMTEAITFFTKGRAEFYLDGVRRADRVPGILSTEHEPVGLDGTFELRYVEPTSRVCIPKAIQPRGQLPLVEKVELRGSGFFSSSGHRYLVCRGAVTVNDKVHQEESTFSTVHPAAVTPATEDLVLLLRFV